VETHGLNGESSYELRQDVPLSEWPLAMHMSTDRVLLALIPMQVPRIAMAVQSDAIIFYSAG
jgi:hypothetical protein